MYHDPEAIAGRVAMLLESMHRVMIVKNRIETR